MRAPALTRLADLNADAISAGVTAFVCDVFGAVPLFLAVSTQLGLTPAEASSWLFIVWFTGGVSSVILSFHYRQPIPIASTVPGLLYLGTLSGRFSFGELAAANLLAALVILTCGLLRLGGRLTDAIPLPVVLGMFAGSLVSYVTGAVRVTVEDVSVAGPTVAGYIVGRALRLRYLPPMALALGAGGVASLMHATPFGPVTLGFPALIVPELHFSLDVACAVTIPMVILALGLGNVQGIGFLKAQGFRVPTDAITVVVGLNSIVNALFGGQPAIVAEAGVAIVGGPDAGRPACRYWAPVIASGLTAILVLEATPIIAIVRALPRSYVAAVIGLAVLSSFQDAIERAFAGEQRFSGLVAFAVAATPFRLAGITSAFWAIVAGAITSHVVGRAHRPAVVLNRTVNDAAQIVRALRREQTVTVSDVLPSRSARRSPSDRPDPSSAFPG